MNLHGLAALIDAARLPQRHIASLQVVYDVLECFQRLFEAHRLDVVIGRGAVGSSGHGSSFHQAAKMGSSGKREPLQVVSAFKQADNPVAAPTPCTLHQFTGCPTE